MRRYRSLSILLASVGVFSVSTRADTRPTDLDGNHEVNLADLRVLLPCLAGPTISPAEFCVLADFDGDHDADLKDFANFQDSFGFGQGPPRILDISPNPQSWIVDDQGLRELRVRFSEPVQVPAGAVSAWTVAGGLHPPSSTSYDSSFDTLTISFSPPVRDERLTIVLDFTIHDLGGTELDGEIDSPVDPVFPSGDGVRAGQAVFRFNILQGDANRDGFVDATDSAIVAAALGLCSTSDPGETKNVADLNGDGCVNVLDVHILMEAMGRTLPILDGVAPSVVGVQLGPDSAQAGTLSAATVRFTEPVRSELLTAHSNFLIDESGGLFVPTSVVVSADARSAKYFFATALSCTKTYSFNVSNEIADTSGALLSRSAVPPTRSGTPPPSPPVVNVADTETTADSVAITANAPEAKTLEVAGYSQVVDFPVSNDEVSASFPLAPNRLNRLYFTAISACGTRSSPQVIAITQDVQPPTLFIDSPANNAEVTTDSVDVAGRVGDMLSGFMGLSVKVNNVNAIVDIGIGNNGTFVRQSVPLTLGDNVINATATDALGNSVSKQISVKRIEIAADVPKMAVVSGNGQSGNIGTVLPQPVVIRVTQSNGTPFSNKIVTFSVIRSNGRLGGNPASLFPTTDNRDPGSLMFQAHTDSNGVARAFWRLGSDAGCGNNRIEVTSTSIVGTTNFCASALPGAPFQLNVGSGNNQKAEVGSIAPDPLRAWISDSCNGGRDVPVTFTVTQGGGKVNGQDSITVNTGPTGHAEVEFMLGPEPGANVVTADTAQNTGSPATFETFGLKRDPTQSTRFTGLVLDNASNPLGEAGILLRVNGQDVGQTTTDIQGQFQIDNIPSSGPADLYVSGFGITTVGGQHVAIGTFPSLHFETLVVPNTENSLPMSVLLPPLNPHNRKNYSCTLQGQQVQCNEVDLTCEGMEGLKMIVHAGTTVTQPDGTKIGPNNPGSVALSLNQVHAADVPMPMPDGAAPPFAWTLQPGGAIFDPPVEIIYPNMSGLPAGAISFFLSFNHDTGRFEIIGSGQVSQDGSTIHSDPGVGITTAGWGCNCPPYSVTGKCCREQSTETPPSENCCDPPCPQCQICDNGACRDTGACCGGQTYNPVTQGCCDRYSRETGRLYGIRLPLGKRVYDLSELCCIDHELLPMHPIRDLSACPARVPTIHSSQVVPEPGDTWNYEYDGCSNRLRLLPVCDVISPLAGLICLDDDFCFPGHCVVVYPIDSPDNPTQLIFPEADDTWFSGRQNAIEPTHSPPDPFLPCDAHDECYQTCYCAADVEKARLKCDKELLDAMLLVCSRTRHGEAVRMTCEIIAGEMYDVLRAFGGGAFSQRQIDTCDCCSMPGSTGLCQPPVGSSGGVQSEIAANIDTLPIYVHSTLAQLEDDADILRIVVDRSFIAVGESTTLRATRVASNGAVIDVTLGASGTAYEPHSRSIAMVSADGIVSAVAPGIVSILVTNVDPESAASTPAFGNVIVHVGPVGDLDNDGLPDAWETANGLDPRDAADAGMDSDGDGLTNIQEFAYATDPQNPDTDGDTVPDGQEVIEGRDPLHVDYVLDGTWTVTANGQSAPVNWDGAFVVSNIAAADLFGAGGPGTVPDFVSDTPTRVIGTRTIEGNAQWAFSEPFQIHQGETYHVGDLTVTDTPPLLPVSIAISAPVSVLEPGQTTQLTTTATLRDGSTRDVTPRPAWTTYRTSNVAVAIVDADGLVTAKAHGTAFITATNDSATAVKRIDVATETITTTVEGFVQLQDETPVAGAAVTSQTFGGSGISNAQGFFNFSVVLPSDATSLYISATAAVNGQQYQGTSQLIEIMPGAVSDAGIIALSPVGQFLHLVFSDPVTGHSLWRSRKNIIRLRFDGVITTFPTPSEIVIREITGTSPTCGTVGVNLDTGGAFTFALGGICVNGTSSGKLCGTNADCTQNGQFTGTCNLDNQTLTIREVGTTLQHRHWYEVTSAGWGGPTGVQAFGPGPTVPNAQFVVQVGDANDNGRVLTDDTAVVLEYAPCLANCGDNNRLDIDGDGRVMNADADAVTAHVPSLPVVKPCGH